MSADNRGDGATLKGEKRKRKVQQQSSSRGKRWGIDVKAAATRLAMFKRKAASERTRQRDERRRARGWKRTEGKCSDGKEERKGREGMAG